MSVRLRAVGITLAVVIAAISVSTLTHRPVSMHAGPATTVVAGAGTEAPNAVSADALTSTDSMIWD